MLEYPSATVLNSQITFKHSMRICISFIYAVITLVHIFGITGRTGQSWIRLRFFMFTKFVEADISTV